MEVKKPSANPYLNLNKAQKEFILNKFSQYRLAKTIGVSLNTINVMFLGKRRTSIVIYEKIAAALGVSLSELLAIK